MKRHIQIGISISLGLILIVLLIHPALMSLDGKPTQKQKLLQLLHSLVLLVQMAMALIIVYCPPFRTVVSLLGLMQERDFQSGICSRRC